MKKEEKKFFVFSFLTILFFILILFFRIFFLENKYLQEEKNIDSQSFEIAHKKWENFLENNDDFSKEISIDLEKIKMQEREKKIIYNYFPHSKFADSLKTMIYKGFFDTFFYSKIINERIDKLWINFYKEKFDVRGRFKDRKIHIFWLHSLPLKEALAIWVHEFWHFYDIYILKKYVFYDLSDKFYDISWTDTRVLKKESDVIDFVSGYAMTNVYEDFAETFTFYILHNEEFKKRAKNSEKLQQKYDFFKKNIFVYWEFSNSNYYWKNYEKNIWDTTKLDYNYDLFKKYLEKMED